MKLFRPNLCFSAAYASLTRIWCQAVPFLYHEKEYSLHLGSHQKFTRGAALHYSWNQTPVCFYAPEQSLCEFLEPTLAGIELQTLGEEMRDLFLSAMQEEFCEIFSQLHEPIEPKESYWVIQPIPNTFSIDFRQGQQNRYQLYISDQDDGTLQLLQHLYQQCGSVSQLKGSTLIFPFRLLVGQTRLTVEEVRSLKVGDILLTQTSKPYAKFYCGKAAFFAEPKEKQFCMTSLLMEEDTHDLPDGIMPDEDSELSELKEDKSNEPTEPKEAAKPTFPIDQLPVVITFEAGQKQMTLDQLQQVHEGYTFELDQKPEDQVQIFANGHSIGQGEWVQINEHLGVRITHLSLQ